jgi:hypothetical protein
MKTKLFNKINHILSRDFNLSLSVGYLGLVFIGIIFQGKFYYNFNINIVQYSDISDFLLAPLQNPKILIFTILSVTIIYLFNLGDDWFAKSYPKVHDFLMLGFDKTKYEEWFSIKGMLLMTILYILFAASIYGDLQYHHIKQAKYCDTKITFKENKYEPSDTLIFIGKTNSYVFLFNRTKKQTDIVPMNDVLKIEISK